MIELLVVIMIVSILMGVGVPSYRYVTNSNRLSAEVNGLLGDMQLARSEAIKQGLSVTVCASKDQVSCSQSSDWSSGWIVFTDPGDVGVKDADETILRTQKALHPGDKLFDHVEYDDGSDEACLQRLWRDLYGAEPVTEPEQA